MRATINGRTVGYIERGSGIPCVLIHGYPLNRMIWRAQWEGLADVARVIALDLRGFGESDAVNAAAEISTFADDVRAFLVARGVRGRLVLGGLSMGGYVALAYLRQYPDQVAGLILANTKATADTLESKANRAKSIALAQASGADAIVKEMLPKLLAPQTYASNPALVARARRIMRRATVPGIVAALGAMRERPDSIPTLLKFERPTLIIAGAADQLMSAADAEKMKRAARDSALVTIPHAGHLTPMEQPEAFNRAVARFLRRVASQS